MTRSRIWLSLLLLFFGAWGAWAVLLDNQPAFSDSVFSHSYRLYESLGRGLGDLPEVLRFSGYRPPLCYLPASLLFLLLGPGLALLRLTVLAQYLAAVWLVHDIARRVSGSRQAGLLAAVLAGATPMTFGWGRMSFVETGMSLATLALVRGVLTCDLRRVRGGLTLGAVVGLGLLTKVAFPIFALGPLLWLLACRVRRAQLLGVTVAAVTAALLAGWWYALQWRFVLVNMQMSSHTAAGEPILAQLWGRLLSYSLEIPGVPLLLGLALAGGLAAGLLRATPGRPLALLGLSTWLPLGLILLFHQSRRYPLPAYWVAAALAGVCVHALLARLEAMGTRSRDREGPREPGTVRARVAGVRLLVPAACAALLGNFVALNLGWRVVTLPPGAALRSGGPRVDGVGLLTPDRRPATHYPAALAAGRRRGCHPPMLLAGGLVAHERLTARRQLHELSHRGPMLPELGWERLRELARRGDAGELCALVVVSSGSAEEWGTAPVTEVEFERACRNYHHVARLKRSLRLGRWGPCPLGLTYTLVQLDAGEVAADHRLVEGRCRLEQVFWDEAIRLD